MEEEEGFGGGGGGGGRWWGAHLWNVSKIKFCLIGWN